MNRSIIKLYSIIVFFLGVVLFYTGCNVTEQKKEMTQAELVEMGKYLVETSACHDCHTPKIFGPEGMQLDTTKLLSGHPADFKLYEVDMSMVGPGKWILTNDHLTAWVGPWGLSYAANLTPDNATGIGAVSEDMFIKTLREGKMKGVGRNILPPMPWDVYGKMTDEDLKAIYAYLRTVPMVKNQVPNPSLPSDVAALYGKK